MRAGRWLPMILLWAARARPVAARRTLTDARVHKQIKLNLETT